MRALDVSPWEGLSALCDEANHPRMPASHRTLKPLDWSFGIREKLGRAEPSGSGLLGFASSPVTSCMPPLHTRGGLPRRYHTEKSLAARRARRVD